MNVCGICKMPLPPGHVCPGAACPGWTSGDLVGDDEDGPVSVWTCEGKSFTVVIRFNKRDFVYHATTERDQKEAEVAAEYVASSLALLKKVSTHR